MILKPVCLPLFLFCLAFNSPGWALSCAPPNFARDIGQSTLVGQGRVIAILAPQAGSAEGPAFKVKIEKFWRKEIDVKFGALTIRQSDWTGYSAKDFPVGAKLVFAVSPDAYGNVQSPLCSRVLLKVRGKKAIDLEQEFSLDELRALADKPTVHRAVPH